MYENEQTSVKVRSCKNDLKREARVVGRELANNCMRNVQESAGEFAMFAARRFVAYLIDQMNERWFA